MNMNNGELPSMCLHPEPLVVQQKSTVWLLLALGELFKLQIVLPQFFMPAWLRETAVSLSLKLTSNYHLGSADEI